MRESLVANLNPRSFLSWPVFLLSLTWSIATNLQDRIHNPEGHYLERLLALVTGHVVLFLALAILVRAIKPLSPLFQSALMIPIVVIVSCLRGLTVWQIMMAFGFDTMELFIYRVFGPITNLGLPLTLGAIAVGRFRAFSQSALRLQQEGALLLELRARAEHRIEEDAKERLNNIRQAILVALDKALGTSNRDFSEGVNRVLEQVVRPLSNQLDLEREEAQRASLEFSARLDWKKAFKESLTPRFLSPLGVSLLFTLASIVFLFVSFEPMAATTLLVIVGAGSFSILYFLKSALLALQTRFRSLPIGFALISGLFFGGALLGVATLFVTLNSESPTILFPLEIYFLVGISVLLAIAGSAQFQAKESIRELEVMTAELAWEVARVAEQQRQIRKKLVGLLHGRLQSAFMSTLLRLQQRKSPESIGELAEEELFSHLKQQILAIELEINPIPKDLQTIIQEVGATWAGIAQVSLSGGDCSQAIARDAQLMTSLGDLIVELTFNSIKHGLATKVQFGLDLLSEDKVSLICKDNGKAPEVPASIGQGTTLLNECSLEWKRESGDVGTETRIILPFKPAS